MKHKQNYDHHLGGYRTEEELEAARVMLQADTFTMSAIRHSAPCVLTIVAAVGVAFVLFDYVIASLMRLAWTLKLYQVAYPWCS